MVDSPKLVVDADNKHQTDVSFNFGKTIHIRSLDIITNCFRSLSLSTKGNDSGAVFMGMAHNGSTLMHTVLEDFDDEGETPYSEGGGRGSSDFPISQKCYVVTPIVPIMTMPPSEGTLTPLTIVTVPL
jgi:hypothetical protein